MFNANGDLLTSLTKKADGDNDSIQGSALSNWQKFNDSLKSAEGDADRSKVSLSDTTPKLKENAPKATAVGDAFVQLVHAASKNKDRVESYKEKE